MNTRIFTVETDARGFLSVTHPLSETWYKLEFDQDELTWSATPAVFNECGDYELADEPTVVNKDLYCLFEMLE